ncbi:MAG: orotidine-5'-phosphate decarboxylase [Spirochaetes bacterium]|nr:orotidine-5'-phosphate decarboxylase [Spirochaetota bacterium]
MSNNFADRLITLIEEKKNPSVVGLDPAIESLPASIIEKYKLPAHGKENIFQAAAEAVLEFNKAIIDSVCDIVPAVKLQAAYYEELGAEGIAAFKETASYAKAKGIITIGDVKRNDIGNTCKAYSNAYLGKAEIFGTKVQVFDFDAVTINSYLGREGVEPFLEDCSAYGKGVFILVKTSNPGSEEFQGLTTDKGKNYFVMGQLVAEWGRGLKGKSGYNCIGAVVGATYPQEAAILRQSMRETLFLVPGYGAQGGSADDIADCFNADGLGALVNSSRGIIFAYKKHKDEKNYSRYAREASLVMKEDISKALIKKGIYRW